MNSLSPVALQVTIQDLVQQLHAALEAPDQIYRKLCRLAQAHELAAEDFRSRLVRAGLPFSRASELKIVFAVREVRREFLAPGQPQSWREALKAARIFTRAQKLGGAAADARLRLFAAQLAGFLHRHQVFECSVAGGTLSLTYRSGDLDALVPSAK